VANAQSNAQSNAMRLPTARKTLTYAMPTSTARRRWFTFSLRTLLVALTALGVWLGWELRIVRARQDMERFFHDWEFDVEYAGGDLWNCGSDCGHPENVSRLRAALGDRPVVVIHCPWPIPADRFARLKELFPEADTDWIFPDEPQNTGH
jgi:hypothetical protein